MSTSAPTFSALFQATAAAARCAQLNLDNRILYRPDACYNIPRVSVNATIDLEEKAPATIESSVGFELITVPDPPPPGPASTVLDVNAVTVLLPPFLVEDRDRTRLFEILTAALNNPSQYSFDFPEPVSSTNLKTETGMLHQFFQSNDGSVGVEFLRISSFPERYLVARLGSRGFPHHDRDGIYIVDLSASVPVTIYSFASSGQSSIYYMPFYEFFAALRQWIAHRMTGVKSVSTGIPARFGSISVQSNTARLWADYVGARAALAAPGDSFTAFAPPFYYQIGNLSAQLDYFVPRNDVKDQPPLIRSRATIRIDPKGGPVAVQLGSPEFLLTGAEFDNFLSIVKNTPNLAAALDVPDGYSDAYTAALNDSERQKSVLVFLSYRDQVPLNEFLVVWTGNLQGEERDFAFTCSLHDNQIANARLVLHLEDPRTTAVDLGPVQRPFSEAQLDDDQYVGVHNFIHAMRIWSMSAQPQGSQ